MHAERLFAGGEFELRVGEELPSGAGREGRFEGNRLLSRKLVRNQETSFSGTVVEESAGELLERVDLRIGSGEVYPGAIRDGAGLQAEDSPFRPLPFLL